MSKLSIIIPVYNVERYIRRCVESIYKQNYENIEIILVDDGSTDNSGVICDELAKEDNRVKVIHKENGGCSVARNVGLSVATGTYFCFIDSDDEWIPNVLTNIMECTKKGYDIIIYGAQITNTNQEILAYEQPAVSKEYSGENGAKDFLLDIEPDARSWALNYIWNRIYKMEIVKNNNIKFDSSLDLGEDFVFNCDVIKHINSVCVLTDILYRYYKYSGNQLTSRFRENELERRDNIFEIHKNLYKSYGIYEEYKKNCYIEEGLITHYSIQKPSYVSCKLSCKQTIHYVDRFMKSDHYNALLEYMDYSGKDINSISKKLYRRKNAFLLGLYLYTLKNKNKLKKIF